MFTKNCIVRFLYAFIIYSISVDSRNGKTRRLFSRLTRAKNEGVVEDNDIRMTYDKEFVEQFCIMETMEVFQLKFEKIDVQSLTDNTLGFHKKTNKKQFEEKHCALVKFRKKMQALQCHNGVIVQSMLSNLKDSIQLRKDEAADKRWMIIDIYQKFKDYVSRMLSVLYYGKINPPSWLWSVYVKFLAVTEWDTYRESIEDDLFEDGQLMADLNNFIGTCVANYYLKVDHGRDENVISTKTDVGSLLSITSCLYNNHNLLTTYKFAHLFVVDNMYLLKFSNQKLKLFESVPHLAIDWHWTMVQFDGETAKCKTSLENGVWLKNPLACFDYRNLIVHVVSTKLLCYTLVHLLTYRKLKFQHRPSSTSSHSETTVDVDKHSGFPDELQKAADGLKIKVANFTEIIRLLKNVKNQNVKQFDRITNELITVITKSLIELRVRNVHKDLVENSIKYIINRAEYGVILDNCNAMKTFYADILSIIHPVDFDFVNFFHSGIVSFPYKFYYNETAVDV